MSQENTGYPDMSVSDVATFKKWKAKKNEKRALRQQVKELTEKLADAERERDMLRLRVEKPKAPCNGECIVEYKIDDFLGQKTTAYSFKPGYDSKEHAECMNKASGYGQKTTPRPTPVKLPSPEGGKAYLQVICKVCGANNSGRCTCRNRLRPKTTDEQAESMFFNRKK